jgi:hypothetical protein
MPPELTEQSLTLTHSAAEIAMDPELAEALPLWLAGDDTRHREAWAVWQSKPKIHNLLIRWDDEPASALWNAEPGHWGPDATTSPR